MPGVSTSRCGLLNRILIVLVVIGASAVAARSASAQPGDGPSGAEMIVEVDTFGVGGVFRPGGWLGVRVRFTDLGTAQRDVIVRVTIDDSDGDSTEWGRVVTANPGQALGSWVYLRLPAGFGFGDEALVTVAEANADANAPDGSGYRAGRVLARLPYSPGQPAESTDRNVLVVGPNPLGLNQLSTDERGRTEVRWSHERALTHLIEPAGLPDRWQGLAPFRTLVWGGASGSRYSPLSLTVTQAEAVREWVSRGGHLVVVLPTAGQDWIAESRNALADLLPDVSVARSEGTDLEPIRWLLTDRESTVLPTDAVVHRMTPLAAAEPTDAMSVIADPSGEGALVVRRVVDAGLVTLVGVPVQDRRLVQAGLPVAEAFWHRVIGGRGDVNRATTNAGTQAATFVTLSQSLDADIARLISKSGRASVGVLLGFVLFGVYWLVAGPVGYLFLRRAERKQHAWVMFFAASVVFTIVAWSGAQAIRPKQVEAQHLSIISSVNGQDTVRVRSWIGMLVPRYGEAVAEIGAGDEASGSERQSDLLAPWDPQSTLTGAVATGAGFPDARAYPVVSTTPRQLTFPARQTVKQLRADWAGPGIEGWGLPRVVGEPGDRFEPEIRYLGPGRMDGTIIHELPGPLREVDLILVEGLNTIGPVRSDSPVVRGSAYSLSRPWEPGTPLNLAQVSGQTADGGRTLLAGPLGLLRAVATAARPRTTQFGVVSDRDYNDRLRALPFLPMLDPLSDETALGTARQRVRLTRAMTQGLDLTPWFTQPCLIVTGRVELDAEDEAALPIPLQLDGREPQSSGMALVWWVYPLPTAPPAFLGPDPFADPAD